MELIRTNIVLSHSFSCLDPYSLAPKVTGWSWPVCPHCFFVFFGNFALNSFYSLLFSFRSERKISINYCVHKMWNTHAALMEFFGAVSRLTNRRKIGRKQKKHLRLKEWTLIFACANLSASRTYDSQLILHSAFVSLWFRNKFS